LATGLISESGGFTLVGLLPEEPFLRVLDVIFNIIILPKQLTIGIKIANGINESTSTSACTSHGIISEVLIRSHIHDVIFYFYVLDVND
jgi:hypothetical protein